MFKKLFLFFTFLSITKVHSEVIEFINNTKFSFKIFTATKGPDDFDEKKAEFTYVGEISSKTTEKFDVKILDNIKLKLKTNLVFTWNPSEDHTFFLMHVAKIPNTKQIILKAPTISARYANIKIPGDDHALYTSTCNIQNLEVQDAIYIPTWLVVKKPNRDYTTINNNPLITSYDRFKSIATKALETSNSYDDEFISPIGSTRTTPTIHAPPFPILSSGTTSSSSSSSSSGYKTPEPPAPIHFWNIFFS